MKKTSDIILVVLSLLAIMIGSLVFDRIVVGYIFVICLIWGYKEKSFFNPYYLFAITPLSLLLYVNLSSNYMLELTARTWGLAILNMTAFLLAVRNTLFFNAWNTCKGPNDNKLLIHTLLLAAIGLFSGFFSYFVGKPFFLSSVFQLCTVPALICSLKSKNKILIIGILAIFLGSSLSLLSKSLVLTYLLAVLIGVEKYFIYSKRQRKNIAVLSVIGILIMVMSFVFANKDRESLSSDETVDYYSQYGNVEWNSNTTLFMPYMYLTTPWANLQYLTESQDTRTYGLWLLRPLVGYLQLDDKFQSQYHLSAYSSFNTFTFISCNFKDFGYWLSFISSIFLGIFVKKIYSRYCYSRSPLDVACYVYVGQAVLEMFFSNEFFMLSFPFTIVIIMALYKLVFFSKSQPQLEREFSIIKYYINRKSKKR